MALDALKGLGHGLLSLVGLGSVYDPLADSRQKLAKANSEFENMFSSDTIQALKQQYNLSEEIIQDMNAGRNAMQAMVLANRQMLVQDIKRENQFIKILALMVLVLYLFMLFQKN